MCLNDLTDKLKRHVNATKCVERLKLEQLQILKSNENDGKKQCIIVSMIWLSQFIYILNMDVWSVLNSMRLWSYTI